MRARVASQAVHWSRSRPVEKVQGASFTSSYETEVSLCASIGPSFDLFVLLGAASGPLAIADSESVDTHRRVAMCEQRGKSRSALSSSAGVLRILGGDAGSSKQPANDK